MGTEHSPLALIHALTASLDAAIEDAIDAHGFSLDALTADSTESVLRFARGDEADRRWRLVFRLPAGQPAAVTLESGGPEPSLALSLAVDGALVPRLADAVRIALSLSALVPGPSGDRRPAGAGTDP